MLGWVYAQNIQILFWTEDIAQKPLLFVFFGYNNCSVSNSNDLKTRTSRKWPWWIIIRAKHINFNQSGLENTVLVVFAINNCSVSKPNDFNTHTISKSTCWDGWVYAQNIQILFWAEDIAKNLYFLLKQYCSVSNPNDFNFHSSSKSTCWDGYLRKTYKFYSELNILLKNLHYLSNTILQCVKSKWF